MMKKKKNDNYLLQGSILAAAGIVVRLIGLLYRIPLNNILGEEGNGYYSAAFNIYNILLILSSYGMPIAVSKLMAGMLAKEEYRKSKKLFFAALAFSGSMGFLFMLIAFWGAKFFSIYCLRMEPSYRALMVLAPTIFFVSIMGVIRGFFQGHGNMVPSAISQIVEQIVNAVVSIMAAYYLLDYGIEMAQILHEPDERVMGLSYAAAGSTLGTCLGAFSGLIVLLILLLRYWKNTYSVKVSNDQNVIDISMKNMLQLIIATMVPIIASQLVYNISDIFDNALFGNIMKMQGVAVKDYTIQWGAYSSYFKLLINIPIAIASSLAASIIPSVTLANTRGKHELVKQKIAESIRFVLLIAMPSAVGLSVLAEPIMKMLFPKASDLPVKLLYLGTITIVFYCISTITNGILQGISHMWKAVSNAVVALVLHLLVVILLLTVCKAEIFAVLAGNILFSFLMCIFNARAIMQYTGYRQEWKNSIIKPAVSALCMGGFTSILYHFTYLLFARNIVAVIVSIPFSGFVYIICLGLFKTFTEDELKNMPKGRLLVKIMKKLHLM